MIDLSQEQIFSLIIRSFLTGCLLGILYEGVRVCRMLMDKDKCSWARRILVYCFVFLTDLAFWLVAASCAILLTYNLGEGVFRGCAYFSMGLGLLLYRATLGRVLLRLEAALTKFLKKLLCAVKRLVMLPIRLFFSLIYSLYALTIGKIIGRIKCRINIKRAEKRSREQNEENVPRLLPECEKEERDVERERYKRSGRISFGERRSS